MAASNDSTTTSPTAEDGANNPHAKTHGRFNNAPWKKLLVYDSAQQTLDVKSEKDISQSTCFSTHPRAELIQASSSDIDRCQIVELPPNRKKVVMYLNSETQTKVTTACIGADGRSNMLFAVFYLDRLGFYHGMLRRLGLLTTLYVTDSASRSEMSSRIVGDQSHGGAG